PSTSVIENGRLAPPENLRRAFAAGGVDLDAPIITTCGSGLTAAILWLALDALGSPPNALYDGSWSEWGSRADLPIEPQALTHAGGWAALPPTAARSHSRARVVAHSARPSTCGQRQIFRDGF